MGNFSQNVKVTTFNVFWLVFNRTLSIYEETLVDPIIGQSTNDLLNKKKLIQFPVGFVRFAPWGT